MRSKKIKMRNVKEDVIKSTHEKANQYNANVVGAGLVPAQNNHAITLITIPSSIKEIEYSAFENCTKLNKVDLGNITTLSFQVFKDCTSLTEITIPSSVKEIEYSAFDNCTKLNKVTILDNVEEMGFYNIDDKDSIFNKTIKFKSVNRRF